MLPHLSQMQMTFLSQLSTHSPNLFDQFPGLGDDICSREADDASHLHGVPASSVSRGVKVKSMKCSLPSPATESTGGPPEEERRETHQHWPLADCSPCPSYGGNQSLAEKIPVTCAQHWMSGRSLQDKKSLVEARGDCYRQQPPPTWCFRGR